MQKSKVIFYGYYKVVGVRKKKVIRIKKAKGTYVGKVLKPSKAGYVTLHTPIRVKQCKVSSL